MDVGIRAFGKKEKDLPKENMYTGTIFSTTEGMRITQERNKKAIGQVCII